MKVATTYVDAQLLLKTTKTTNDAALSLKADKASPTFTGTTAISSGGTLTVGGTQTTGVYTNNIEAVAPNAAIFVRSGLVIASDYGLETKCIGSNVPLNDLAIISNCVVGTVQSNQNLTVHGIVDVKQNLKVGALLQVDNLVPNVTAEITVPGNFAVNGDFMVDTMRTSYGSFINIEDNVEITGSLSVGGTNILQSLNPNWVAVIIGFSGSPASPYFIKNAGRQNATNLIRTSGLPTGAFQFDFPAHPQGVNYLFSGAAIGGYVAHGFGRTSTRINFAMRNSQTSALQDAECHVLISAY